MRHESSGYPRADNPKSSAFGCGQLTIVNRLRFAKKCGVHHATTSVSGQMCMMRYYIKTRYRTAERALAFRLRNGWY